MVFQVEEPKDLGKLSSLLGMSWKLQNAQKLKLQWLPQVLGILMFRDTYSHVLKEKSVRLVCKFEANVFRINGKYWMQLPNGYEEVQGVEILRPNKTNVTTMMEDLLPFDFGAGLFGSKLNNLLDAILFIFTREAIEGNIDNALIALDIGEEILQEPDI